MDMFQKKFGSTFLTSDKGDSVLKKYDQVFSGIKHHIGKIDDYEVVYNTDYAKIKFLSDGVFYPQVYLDDALYQI